MSILTSGTAGIVFASAIGVLAGLAAYTFYYAKGYSYLTNDPGACANCHVMTEQYNAWLKSSHRNAAACNDCHTPHNMIGKYLTKASNGFWHSFAFTTGRFHEPIRIKARNHEITEQACRSCHETVVHAIEGGPGTEKISCVRCHLSVGHMH